MQHWQTYQKFNRRLFEERYVAWLAGQLKKHPADGWYGGELWFFDNYIIPLSKKLKKCGVFGVTYDEFVTYAVENRREWVQKGKMSVDDMQKQCEAKYSEIDSIGKKPHKENVLHKLKPTKTRNHNENNLVSTEKKLHEPHTEFEI